MASTWTKSRLGALGARPPTLPTHEPRNASARRSRVSPAPTLRALLSAFGSVYALSMRMAHAPAPARRLLTASCFVRAPTGHINHRYCRQTDRERPGAAITPPVEYASKKEELVAMPARFRRAGLPESRRPTCFKRPSVRSARLASASAQPQPQSRPRPGFEPWRGVG